MADTLVECCEEMVGFSWVGWACICPAMGVMAWMDQVRDGGKLETKERSLAIVAPLLLSVGNVSLISRYRSNKRWNAAIDGLSIVFLLMISWITEWLRCGDISFLGF